CASKPHRLVAGGRLALDFHELDRNVGQVFAKIEQAENLCHDIAGAARYGFFRPVIEELRVQDGENAGTSVLTEAGFQPLDAVDRERPTENVRRMCCRAL